jgi:hypothetical protein
VDILSEKVTLIRDIITTYAKPALTGEMSYLTQNAEGTLFSVVDIDVIDGMHVADTGLVARIMGDFVIIEHDMNEKPLVDALIQSGIKRSQIILAYAGEPVPDPAS